MSAHYIIGALWLVCIVPDARESPTLTQRTIVVLISSVSTDAIYLVSPNDSASQWLLSAGYLHCPPCGPLKHTWFRNGISLLRPLSHAPARRQASHDPGT